MGPGSDRETFTTVRGPSLDGARRAPFWHFTVVHHAHDPSFVGAYFALGAAMQAVLGRDCDVLTPAVFEDRRTSRRHCVLRVGPDSALTLEDCGSTNGTRVNGRRVGNVELADGDVLSLPGVALCAANVAAVYVPGGATPLVARNAQTAALRDAIEGLAPTLGALLVYGEPGSGVDAVRLAWARGRRGPTEPWSDEDPPLLAGPESADAPAPREPGEVVAVTVVDTGSLAARARVVACVDALRAQGARVLLWVPVPRLAIDRSAEAVTLARSLGAPALRLPPLRRRAEDLPALIVRAQRTAHGHAATLSVALASAIVRAPFLRNLPSLTRFARTMLAPAPDGSVLELDEARETALLGDRDLDEGPTHDAQRAAAAPGEPRDGDATVRIRRDARGFSGREGELVDLSRRPLLVRLLGELLEGAKQGADTSTSSEALIERLWPGARFVGDSGSNRLYVAIATLRKLGLRDAIVRDEGGYRLDLTRVELVDPPR